MADLYLLAIKSRGEATFEIGEKLHCPECGGYPFGGYPENLEGPGCAECDNSGFWWITNHGYRAHPWAYWNLAYAIFNGEKKLHDSQDIHILPDDFDSWPDLFPAKQSKSIISSGKSLLQSLGLLPKVVRRL